MNWKVISLLFIIYFLYLRRRNDPQWSKNKQEEKVKEDYLVTSKYPYPGYAWYSYYHPNHCGLDGTCKDTPYNHGYITNIPDTPYHPYYGRPLYVPWNLSTRFRYQQPWYYFC